MISVGRTRKGGMASPDGGDTGVGLAASTAPAALAPELHVGREIGGDGRFHVTGGEASA
jgi:hypothetical protein